MNIAGDLADSVIHAELIELKLELEEKIQMASLLLISRVKQNRPTADVENKLSEFKEQLLALNQALATP